MNWNITIAPDGITAVPSFMTATGRLYRVNVPDNQVSMFLLDAFLENDKRVVFKRQYQNCIELITKCELRLDDMDVFLDAGFYCTDQSEKGRGVYYQFERNFI